MGNKDTNNYLKSKAYRMVVVIVSLPVLDSFATAGTVALQASLSLGFLRQEYWDGWTFPSPRDLPDPSDRTWVSWLAGRFFTAKIPGKPISNGHMVIKVLNERKSEEA